MDPFTQRMLEKAEQRSRALGISNASKYPLAECSSDANVGASAVAMAASQQQQQQAQKSQPQQSSQSQSQQQQQEQAALRAAAASSGNGSGAAGHVNRLQVVERTTSEVVGVSGCSSPSKVLRQFSAIDKENMDLGIEINIMTDKRVEVQVQVEEQEITDDDEGARLQLPAQRLHVNEPTNQPLAKIRDSSRNRLQRLGALYSNTADLSSPIHRTEAQFHAGPADDTGLEGSPKKAKQHYGKLVALADSINQWEDDTMHHHQQAVAVAAVAPPKPDLPSRRLASCEPAKKARAPAPPTVPALAKPNKDATFVLDHGGSGDAQSNKTKQLKWDPKVIHSLEAQGFQRRESSTVKLAYDYCEDKEQPETEQPQRVESKTAVSKLANTFSAPEERKVEKKPPAVKSGLVSGRAAAFESKANQNQQSQRPQKDPTELSLKERMQLFERNKGEALVPKAAFGMAPSINKIRQDKAPLSASSSSSTTSSGLKSVSQEPSKVRDKVAALVANAATISEHKIKAEISKQRQEDMQVLANRFNKQKQIFGKEQQPPQQQQQQQQQDVELKTDKAKQSQVKATTAALIAASSVLCPPPPPPPPMLPPQTHAAASSSKRRSPGDAIDDEESKRARKSTATAAAQGSAMSRLYPALSDLDTNDSVSEDDNGAATTATASARSTADEAQQQQKHLVVARRSSQQSQQQHALARDYDNEEEHDSYVESEADDSSVGICNGSLGREVMQVVVQNNEHSQQQQQKHQHHQQQQQQQQQQCTKQIKEVRYAEVNHYYGGGDSSLNSSGEASMGMDDYLDEALADNIDDDGDDDYTQDEDEDDDENTSRASKGSKGTTTSNSFSFRKTPKKYTNYQTISEEHDDFQTPLSHTATGGNKFAVQPVKSQLSVNQEDENMVTLVHTVSFYRRQQSANSANSTPVRKVMREQQLPRSAMEAATATALQFETPPAQQQQQQQLQHQQQKHSANTCNMQCTEDEDTLSESDSDDTHLVQEKIKKLLDEVCKQQQVIAQTSQALNLCAATIEFSGSTESVEGERHLLVATHRRQACLDEVQRLRVEHSLRPLGAPREKGRLTVKEITVPLRQDYIRKLAADTISGHHLVCLLKYNEHVLATKTVPTLPGLLAVKFPDVLQMNSIYADFRITLEIYGMTAQREVLPHEVKYHINLNKKSGVKTPKKKGGENRLVMPPVQSPAGPHVVRTPALVQYGFAIFSLREMQRTTWSLTQVLGVCPLDGVVHMKVDCELSVSVEHKGFLTMFEDISGFGAWHRRWCQLNGTVLNYWKYPDDEKKKTPMGSIDLYACSSQMVGLAPRDICARLNTMLLECQRPARDTDRESLIIVPQGRHTIVRHLLSADTKEEREEWCAYFNKALTLLRAWGPPQ